MSFGRFDALTEAASFCAALSIGAAQEGRAVAELDALDELAPCSQLSGLEKMA
jgi:hypothetical protein